MEVSDPALAATLHKLKGSAATLGAKPLRVALRGACGSAFAELKEAIEHFDLSRAAQTLVDCGVIHAARAG